MALFSAPRRKGWCVSGRDSQDVRGGKEKIIKMRLGAFVERGIGLGVGEYGCGWRVWGVVVGGKK